MPIKCRVRDARRGTTKKGRLLGLLFCARASLWSLVMRRTLMSDSFNTHRVGRTGGGEGWVSTGQSAQTGSLFAISCGHLIFLCRRGMFTFLCTAIIGLNITISRL